MTIVRPMVKPGKSTCRQRGDETCHRDTRDVSGSQIDSWLQDQEVRAASPRTPALAEGQERAGYKSMHRLCFRDERRRVCTYGVAGEAVSVGSGRQYSSARLQTTSLIIAYRCLQLVP